MRALFLLLVVAFGFGCASRDARSLEGLEALRLYDAAGKEHALSQLSGEVATVYFILAPDCPMCRNYAGYLASFGSGDQAVHGVGIFPSAFIDADSVQAFAREFDITMPLLMDPDCVLSNALNAQVTPEAFLISASGELRYHGAIDNWAVRAGRKKLKATEFYLEDEIARAMRGWAPERTTVEAVGCVLECD